MVSWCRVTRGAPVWPPSPSKPDFDLAVLHRHLVASLPDYARPRFLRVCERLEVTGTFKPMKARLMQEGYSSSVAPDPVWFYDRSRGAFVDCDDTLRAAIDSGAMQGL